MQVLIKRTLLYSCVPFWEPPLVPQHYHQHHHRLYIHIHIHIAILYIGLCFSTSLPTSNLHLSIKIAWFCLAFEVSKMNAVFSPSYFMMTWWEATIIKHSHKKEAHTLLHPHTQLQWGKYIVAYSLFLASCKAKQIRFLSVCHHIEWKSVT